MSTAKYFNLAIPAPKRLAMRTTAKTPVRASHITAALKTLNEKRGFVYPSVGYCYYADIKGDGRNIKNVYAITNAAGGVTRSHLNGYTMRDTLEKIERAIETARKA